MKKVLYAAALFFLATACTTESENNLTPGKKTCINVSLPISLVQKLK